MNEQFEKEIYGIDPVFFRQKDLDMAQTCMCWGIECGDGWRKPITEFVRKVKILNGILAPSNMCIVASQIKSKWAEFTCYWNMDVLDGSKDGEITDAEHGVVDTVYGLMDDAVDGCVAKCSHTCELCGKESMFEDEVFACGSWLTVKCVECAQKQQREAGRVTNFKDGFMFLSPFAREAVVVDGERYRTPIAAYYGTLHPEHRGIFLELASPSEAQSIASNMGLCRDDDDAFDAMRKVLEARYSSSRAGEKLLSTDGLEIASLNCNHENKWGSCWCSGCGDKGENRYGKMLMEIRETLKKKGKTE